MERHSSVSFMHINKDAQQKKHAHSSETPAQSKVRQNFTERTGPGVICTRWVAGDLIKVFFSATFNGVPHCFCQIWALCNFFLHRICRFGISNTLMCSLWWDMKVRDSTLAVISVSATPGYRWEKESTNMICWSLFWTASVYALVPIMSS